MISIHIKRLRATFNAVIALIIFISGLSENLFAQNHDDYVEYKATHVASNETSDIIRTDDHVGNIIVADKVSELENQDNSLTENSMLAYIPENSWRPPGMEGRELTEELAQEYPQGNFIARSMDNTSWGVGEHLVFSIDYGFYTAGTATMSVIDTKDINGGECYHVRTTAHSNDFISAFYEVNDRVDTYIDVHGLFTRRFEKHLREGKYKSDRIVDFYHDRLLALNTKKNYAVTEIPLYVQDILSVLYFIRTFPLEVKKTQMVDVYADGKVYPLEIIVHKKEKIKVPAGTFECLLVEPKLKSEGLFRQKGTLLVWLTNDEYRMPVKMTSKIAIGSIGTNLKSYSRTQ